MPIRPIIIIIIIIIMNCRSCIVSARALVQGQVRIMLQAIWLLDLIISAIFKTSLCDFVGIQAKFLCVFDTTRVCQVSFIGCKDGSPSRENIRVETNHPLSTFSGNFGRAFSAPCPNLSLSAGQCHSQLAVITSRDSPLPVSGQAFTF